MRFMVIVLLGLKVRDSKLEGGEGAEKKAVQQSEAELEEIISSRTFALTTGYRSSYAEATDDRPSLLFVSAQTKRLRCAERVSVETARL
jgi:hypothetical protein